jgi:hypothetical protein
MRRLNSACSRSMALVVRKDFHWSLGKRRKHRAFGGQDHPGRAAEVLRLPQTLLKMGTIFQDSHAPLRLWLQAIHLICSSKKGISTRQLQRTLCVGMNTAWFMGQRIRAMMAPLAGTTPPVGGEDMTVEADWTYVGRKPGTKVRPGAGHMNVVFALVERNGEARSYHVPDVTGATLISVLDNEASKKSHLRTDDARVFTYPGKHFKSRETVMLSEDEYVRATCIPTPSKASSQS